MSDPRCPRCGSSFGGTGLDDPAAVELCPQCALYPEASTADAAAPGDAAPAGGPSGAETVLVARAAGRRGHDQDALLRGSSTVVAIPGAVEAPVATLTVKAFLKWEGGPADFAPLDLRAGSTLVGGEGATLQIPDAALAPHHFRIEARGNEFFLHDFSGSGGTYLNGYRVRAVKLMSGDRITAGSATFSFTIR